MGFIAKIALRHGGRFIKVGEAVPRDYNRFAEGIKRGWIEDAGDPAAAPPPVNALADEPRRKLQVLNPADITTGELPTPATAPPLIIEDAACVTGSIIVPDEPPAYVEPAIEDLDYLNPMAQKSLADQNIVSIRDLDGWDVEALDELRGIGVKLAERLLADFAKWKESFSEYTEIKLDTETDVVSAEVEDAGNETDESGEDESP